MSTLVRRTQRALFLAVSLSSAAVPSHAQTPGPARLAVEVELPGRAAAADAAPFDWIVPPGSSLSLDTVLDRISGGDGAITGARDVVGGRIEVRNVEIGEGAQVVFRGPNPVTIVASGTVRVLGKLDVSGTDGESLIAAPQPPTFRPAPGARGRAGGGQGGTASLAPTGSTARGGSGQGAFERPGAGGQGGESGYHPLHKNARRGAGGGGGRFGPDVRFAYQGIDALCQTRPGMDAEPGFPGGPEGTGALSQSARARGGRMGLSPFRDSSAENDFYGVARSAAGIVVGELERPWAGSGGGAGGDAIRSDVFPNPLAPALEESGGPGGGGGGSLTILATGDIVVGPAGRLVADGGHGGGGENSNFFDRVGGGGGGGSGGHLILQSLGVVRIDALAAQAGLDYDDPAVPGFPELEHPERPISARGGQGAAGRDDVGGARAEGEGAWKCDSIPLDRLAVAGVEIPPLGSACFANLGGDPIGTVPGAGGDGGPGLIQIHVRNPATDLVVPGAAGGDLTQVFVPRPVGWRDGVFELHLLPQVEPLGRLHSRWIRLRTKGLDPETGAPPPVVRLPDFALAPRF